MTRPKYVASCSGGKDSVATLLLAAQHNEPLDEAVFSEVMFDKDTSGGAVAHVTAPLLFVESKNKRHVFVKIKACATDFLENQKFSMDL